MLVVSTLTLDEATTMQLAERKKLQRNTAFSNLCRLPYDILHHFKIHIISYNTGLYNI